MIDQHRRHQRHMAALARAARARGNRWCLRCAFAGVGFVFEGWP